MRIEFEAIISQNITLVYDSLDLRHIDTSVLKTLRGESDTAMVMDTPEMIVAVYTAENTIVQVGDRRIRITLQRPSEEIGEVPLWEMAAVCSGIVEDNHLTAYGFNYDIKYEVPDSNAHQKMTELFLHNPESVAERLSCDLVSSFTPRFRFERDEIIYDLIIQPLDSDHIKVHLNAHFQGDEISMPDTLETDFREEYNKIVSALPDLLREAH